MKNNFFKTRFISSLNFRFKGKRFSKPLQTLLNYFNFSIYFFLHVPTLFFVMLRDVKDQRKRRWEIWERNERTQANVKTREKRSVSLKTIQQIYITVTKNYINLRINLYTIRNKTFICVQLLTNNISWSLILLAIQNTRSNNIL